jgi:hypothetical protein
MLLFCYAYMVGTKGAVLDRKGLDRSFVTLSIFEFKMPYFYKPG